MNYFQKKKLAFMSIVNRVKGFVRTITGALPLTLEGCVDEESIIDYTIYGQSVQDGTPAPEAPVEVESVGEKIVNLFSGYEESFDGYYADTGDLVTTLSIRTVQYIPVKPNTVYTVRGRCTKTFKTGIIRVVQFNNDKAFIRRNLTSQAYRPIATFTTTEDASFLAICYDNDETGVIATVTDIQIDEGAVPTDYNLYNKYKIPIKVSGKNLFNYADYTTLTKYNGDDISANWLTIDGDLFYIKYDYYNGGCWLTPTKQWELSSGTYTLSGKCKDNTIKGKPDICYCGIRWSDDTRNAGWGKINSNDGEWYNFSYTFTITEDKTVKGIYLQDNGATTKSSICFTNIQLEQNTTASDYEPYHEPITTNIYLDEPLGAGQSINYKKDGLPTIPTFKGTSIISTDTTIQPSNVEITYYSNVKE